MRGYGRSKANSGSIAVMFAVITLLVVYIANIAPIGRAALFFLSSVFIYGTMAEHAYAGAFISFFAVGFVGFLIVPDNTGMIPYLLFFGHYGIFRYFVETAASGGALAVLKLVYYNICMALIYFFGGGFMLANIPWEIPWWLLLVLSEVVFIIYELIFTKIAQWYSDRGRSRLLGRSWG